MNKAEELEYGDKLFEEKGGAAAFTIAAANSWLHIMKWLLDEQGVHINSRSSSNQDTALHIAARLGLKQVTQFLIQHNADLNLTNNMDLTPLMCACGWYGKKMATVALMLIKAGADVHYVRESDHQNALTFALRGAEPEVIEALKKAGAVDVTPPPEVLEKERNQQRYPHLVKKGRSAFKAGRFEESVKYLEEAAAINQLDPVSEKYLNLAKKKMK